MPVTTVDKVSSASIVLLESGRAPLLAPPAFVGDKCTHLLFDCVAKGRYDIKRNPRQADLVARTLAHINVARALWKDRLTVPMKSM